MHDIVFAFARIRRRFDGIEEGVVLSVAVLHALWSVNGWVGAEQIYMLVRVVSMWA